MGNIGTMSRTWSRTRLALLAAIVALGIGIIAPVGKTLAMPASQSQGDVDMLKMLSGKDFEIDFMSMMIQHHQTAIEMAKLVPERANHQEVKDAAAKIITDQTREIGDMTAWLKAWYNTDPKPGMMQGDMSTMMSNLEGLKGDEFDKEFLKMMRMHHMGAIEMAKLVPDRATHQELKDLGDNVITSQSAEITEFEGWLMSWYGIDASSEQMPGMSGDHEVGMPRTGMSGGGGSGPMTMLFMLAAFSALLLAGGLWFRRRA